METTPIPGVEHEILKQRRKAALVALIIVNGIFFLLLIPAAYAALMSPFIFDAGESTGKWIFAINSIGFPFTVILSFCAWIPFAMKKYTAAIIVSLLPLINVFIYCLFFAGILEW